MKRFTGLGGGLRPPRFVGRTIDAFSHQAYRLYTFGNAGSMIGNWMHRTAVGWLAWELSQSPFWVAVVVSADLLPSVVLGVIAGAYADRMDRLSIIFWSQFGAMLSVFLLAVLTMTGMIGVMSLAAVSLFQGALIGFNQPSRMAVVTTLVPARDLSAALAINSVIFNLARFVGPGLAALLILVEGATSVFIVNGLSFLFFLIVLKRLDPATMQAPSRPQPRPGDPPRSDRLAAMIWEGFLYAVRHPICGPFLLLHMALGLVIRPLIELLPAIVGESFEGNVATLALLNGSIGAGAVLAGLWLVGISDNRRLIDATFAAGIISPIAGFALVAIAIELPAVLASAVLGGILVVAGVGTQSLVQISVDESMLGRTLSIYGILFRGCPAVGALAFGAAAEHYGLIGPTALAAIAVCLLTVAVALLRRRRLMEALATSEQARAQAVGRG